jgi:hypothetical protein
MLEWSLVPKAEWRQSADSNHGWRSVYVTADAATRAFARLHKATHDKAIEDFVGQFGPMMLDPQGDPVFNAAEILPQVVEIDGQIIAELTCYPSETWEQYLALPVSLRDRARHWQQEPLQAWREWSRLVYDILIYSQELKNQAKRKTEDPRGGHRIHARDMSIPDGLHPASAERIHRVMCSELARSQTIDGQWQALMYTLNWEILDLGVVATAFRPVLAGSADVPHVGFGFWSDGGQPGSGITESAFPLVMAGLLAAVSSTSGYNVCTGCCLPYRVKSIRKNGRCDDCKKAENRRHSREYQKRKRLAAKAM